MILGIIYKNIHSTIGSYYTDFNTNSTIKQQPALASILCVRICAYWCLSLSVAPGYQIRHALVLPSYCNILWRLMRERRRKQNQDIGKYFTFLVMHPNSCRKLNLMPKLSPWLKCLLSSRWHLLANSALNALDWKVDCGCIYMYLHERSWETCCHIWRMIASSHANFTSNRASFLLPTFAF